MARDGLRVRRTKRGDFELRLPEVERDVLRSLPAQMRELLEERDPSTRRLFPPAYSDDPALQEEYEGMVQDDLDAGRRRSFEVLEETLDAKRLDEEQVTAWLTALNDTRLVLGTRLGIEQEDYAGDEVAEDDPRAPLFALYHYLGWLVSQVVDALAAGLDAGGNVPD
jgi:hypothetical protein